MKPKYILPELLARITPVNVHDEVDFGADVGQERAPKAETVRYFAARSSRTTPQRAKALLTRLGTRGELRDDDRLDAE